MREDWLLWVAENVARGVPKDKLAEILREHGMSADTIDTATTSVASQLDTITTLRLRRRLAKALWTLSCLERSRATTDLAIERRPTISRQEFIDGYYARSRPLVLTQSPEFFGQFEDLSLARLRRDFGQRTVEFQSGRSREPDYEVNSGALRVQGSLAELLDRITGAPGNDVYLTANNTRANRELMDELLRDKRGPANLCGPDWDPTQVFLWLGPAGSVTPLHHDLTNNALAQIFGRKVVRLISPFQLEHVYNHRHCYSEVDPTAVDLEKHPAFAQADVQTVKLMPGEILFIPVGWWHHVTALDVSASLSLTCFGLPNQYEDIYPSFLSGSVW
jgi:ribosomal protein L16 Arg81 hydroxylase